MRRGYFKHHRKIEDWPWRNNPNYYTVWMRCLELATYRERKTRVGRNTKPLTLKPGQFVSGRYAIAKDTGVSPSSVRNILESLVLDNQLDIDKSSQGSVFTVINWAEYQKVDNEVDNHVTTNGQPMDTTQEVKNVKNVKEYTNTFSQFWDVYPRKQNKWAAFKAWNKLDGIMPPLEELIEIVETQKTWPQFQKFTPHGSTWLNGHKWEDGEHIQTSKSDWVKEI